MRNLGTKEEIRKKVLKERALLTDDIWQTATDSITASVCGHVWFREAEILYCYIDFRREVGTRKIVERAWQQGKKVCVPKVCGNDMQFYEIRTFSELVPGSFGIPEPSGEGKTFDKNGLMLMPGAAFDTDRNRIGYGRGYYDRFLSEHPDMHTIALGFDMQIVSGIVPDEQDIRPDILLTESRWISNIQTGR